MTKANKVLAQAIDNLDKMLKQTEHQKMDSKVVVYRGLTVVKICSSAKTASEETQVGESDVSACVTGKLDSMKGYSFEKWWHLKGEEQDLLDMLREGGYVL